MDTKEIQKKLHELFEEHNRLLQMPANEFLKEDVGKRICEIHVEELILIKELIDRKAY